MVTYSENAAFGSMPIECLAVLRSGSMSPFSSAVRARRCLSAPVHIIAAESMPSLSISRCCSSASSLVSVSFSIICCK